MTVINGPAELQSSSIRGGAEYLRGKAEQNLANYLSVHVKDAWYGHQAQEMTPEVVRTVSAITRALGEKAAGDVNVIDKTAELVGAHGKPEDYIGAYNMIKSPTLRTFAGAS